MHISNFSTLLLLTLCTISTAHAAQRIPQLNNDQVSVWETIIPPGKSNLLTMHRHEHNRVLVPLTDGLLKVTNDQGKSHLLKFEKNKAVYLTKDVPNELHRDENLSRHAVKVLVIEIKP